MTRRSLFIAMVMVSAALPVLWRSASTAQPATDQFKGTWTLVSIRYVNPDGSAIEPFGPQAKGMLVFDGTHFATQVMAANLPKFTSNNRMVGTPREYEAISHGVVAYFGTYTVNDADKSINLRVESSSFPNQNGTQQKRPITAITDDVLTYNVPNPAASSGITHIELVWRRAK